MNEAAVADALRAISTAILQLADAIHPAAPPVPWVPEPADPTEKPSMGDLQRIADGR
jgi:hypothetical protein